MDHPCIECLVLAACKDKPLLGLVRKCELLNTYLYGTTDGGDNMTMKFMKIRRVLGTNYQILFQNEKLEL